jgi:NTP pyrophosphatase (non-canonical NTP hydrolase)
VGEHPLNALARRCFEESKANGWHDPREIDGVVRNASPGERIALIHEEATELLREVRKGTPASFWTECDGKPEGAAAELADIVIRCLDYAGMYGIPLGDVIEQKLAYNRQRTDWAPRGEKVL